MMVKSVGERERPMSKPSSLRIRLTERMTSLRGFTTSLFETPTLVTLRNKFGWADCYDPRDRVYGVLSMLSGWLREGIVSDYTKSFGDVYKDVVLCHLHNTLNMSILRAREFSEGTHIPSWVPDWSKKSTRGGFIHGQLGQLASSQITLWFTL